MPIASPRSGGQILIDQLRVQGVTQVYCIPGESDLAALDALYDLKIEVVVCRQEAGAAMAALTEGRLTGRPGICFVTRGPGATNAAHGVHIAEHDLAAMILFIGQVDARDAGAGRLSGDGLPSLFQFDRKMGHPDRNGEANPRSGPSRVSHRHAGKARTRRDRTSGGHACGDCGRRRRAARGCNPNLAWARADGRVAKNSLEGRTPDRDPWGSGLDRPRQRGIRPVRGALRYTRRGLISPRECLRWRP